MSSVYFFLVAEASAISSAPKTMSRGTFFSRARTSTSITNSRLPATTGLLAATLNPSQFRHQPRPLDIVELQTHRLPFELHCDAPIFRAAEHPHEPAPSGRIRRTHPHVRLVSGETRKITRLAQRPVETRGRHFQPLLRGFAPFAGLQIARQLDWPVAHAQEPADPGTDRFEHPPDFPITALLERDAIPAVGAARMRPFCRLDARERRQPIFQMDALAQLFKVRGAQLPLHPRRVFALDLVARM